MKHKRWISIVVSLGFLTGCTAVIFEHETGGQQQLLRLSRPLDTISIELSAPATDPDVSFDEQRIAFIQQDGGGVQQVYVMTLGQPTSIQQVTTDPTPKRVPRWSAQGKLAFASGSDVVVLNADFSTFNLGGATPQTDGGLDFYDDGDKLVYERNGNLYTVPLNGSTSEQRITNCSIPTVRCTFPVVSHDQSKLAYKTTIMLGAGWPEIIYILSTGIWSGQSFISMGPALGGGGKIHSYDFSPGDDQMYVAALPFDAATSTYGAQHELFVVNLDGTDKEMLPPGSIVRHPSAYQSFP